MKRFLILFMMLCLIVSSVAVISCGDNDTDTGTDTSSDTNTDTDSSVTDTNTDTNNEFTCEITVKDQENEAVANVKIAIYNKDQLQINTVTTDENGKATVTVTKEYTAQVIELPEGYLNTAETVTFDGENKEVSVLNNIPNGTVSRPYPISEENEIKLGANETVYYIVYGGDRNFLIENAQDLVVTYGDDEPRETDEENKISFKMPPTEATSRAVIVKFENKSSEEKTYVLSIFSDKGAYDNPYDVVLGQQEKVTVATEQIVYYKYVAEKDGMVVVYSESADNSIYFYNTTKMTVSTNTNGSKCEYIYANKGDEVTVYVSSNGENNYNKVEFTVNQHSGTKEDPIPLYKDESTFTLQSSQSLTFSVTSEKTKVLLIENSNVKLIMNETETLPSEDGIIDGIMISGTKTFAVVNTNENEKEDITISVYENASES